MDTIKVKAEKWSNFYMFFNDIINELNNCYWIINRYDSYYYPPQNENDDEDLLGKDIIDYYGDYILVSNLSMKKIAPYIKDDGSTLICFKGEKREFKRILDTEDKLNLDIQTYPEQLKALNASLEKVQIKAYIYNYDAIEWGIICNNYKYIGMLEDNLKKIKIDYVEKIEEEKIDIFKLEKYNAINIIDTVYKMTILNIRKSSFYSVYRPIINRMKECCWITNKDNFYYLSIEKTEQDSVQNLGEYIIFDNEIMKSIAREIRDIKSVLVCFKKNKIDAQQIVRLLKQIDGLILNNQTCTTENILKLKDLDIEMGIYLRDDDYWEMFCNDKRYTEALKEVLKNNN